MVMVSKHNINARRLLNLRSLFAAPYDKASALKTFV